MTTDNTDNMVDALAEAMQAPQVRIDLGWTMSISEGIMPCAAISVKSGSGHWHKALGVPLIVPPKGEGRTELLSMLANFANGVPTNYVHNTPPPDEPAIETEPVSDTEPGAGVGG